MESVDRTDSERIAAFFEAGDRFSRENGVRVVEVRPGFARTEMTVDPSLEQRRHPTRRRVVLTLADLAFALASKFARRGGCELPGGCHVVQSRPFRQADRHGR